ncbi:enoyl-CoA hydratase [Pusillimonas sp. SM2304]|uniref:enoyl-CoA hydratase n=1 Tax=Pusillimonas sp. SM2304 TaxID=3073241 RepID=UPI002874ADBC|nr:enoyl-CoA hydratase [Pusillimonas sp. SM2304]MDS1139383.1 enoyl-CoA hydratase [Pusillimonas sp. SM2304]
MAAIHGEVMDGVAWLKVDNASKRNAMTLAMWRAIPHWMTQFEANPDVRVVMLTGAGNQAFISGADISEFAQVRSTPEDVEAYESAVRSAETAIRDSALPTVAAVNGLCYGGGLGLAGSCDLRYAARSARFRMPAARLGLGYGMTGVKAFLELLGPSSLKEVFFMGEPFDAERARQIGFVNQVFDDETFAEDAARLAETIASNAPLTLRALKRTIRAINTPDDARQQEEALQAIQACFDSADYKEGQLAFAQKRRPVFQGR